MASSNLAEKDAVGLVAVGTRLPSSLVADAKQAALDEKTTFQNILIDALRDWLARNKPANRAA